jgi:hypothetical protein
MSVLTGNPLTKHFRQPAIYIKLPSEGRWYEDGDIDLPVTGEIPIYPMTAKDELTMKTPDALLNGASTAHVIESCCPAIKNAWRIPTVDIDAILIAIRIASYGKQLDFKSKCPHCTTENEKAIDLSFILDNINPSDWSQTVNFNGLEIILKPQTYEDYNKNNVSMFEEQRILQLVQDQEISEEEKIKKFDVMFQKLIVTGIKQVTKSIAGVKLEDGTVVTRIDYITEFLNNCDRKLWDLIKDRLDTINKQNNEHNQMTIDCENPECGKQFTAPFMFEQTNFFG